MRVRVTYAPKDLCKPTDGYNPYAPLSLTIEGDLDTVANWLDEHVVAGYCALSGYGPNAERYEQGRMTPAIKRALAAGGKFGLGNDTLLAEHTS